jgi:hypothetical protein
MTTPPAPARLFVLLAREAPVGVILRRGPSQWTQLIKWNTDTDAFEPGQWLKAQILTYSCDLSPNGKLLIYGAYRHGNSRFNPDIGDSWTAISKPPYFTALVLFYSPFGGYFVEDNFVQGITYAHPNSSLGPLYIQGQVGYHNWQQHQGWQLVRAGQWKWPDASRLKLDPPAIWQKYSIDYTLTMEYLQDSRGYGDHYRYTLTKHNSNHEVKLAKVRWADIDQHGRIILAKDGKLFTAAIRGEGELTLTELADFNANKPEQVKTPSWARRW